MRGFGPAQAHPLTSGMRSARWPHGLSGSREDLAVEPGEPDAARRERSTRFPQPGELLPAEYAQQFELLGGVRARLRRVENKRLLSRGVQ
jgi:hypothetical protein